MTHALLGLLLLVCPAQAPADSGAALEPWRASLLELANDAACAFPLDPHAKNRSRAQLSVVEGWLALDRPVQASECAAGILDWRRGAAYAMIARHLACAGAAEEAADMIALAQDIADAPHEGAGQDWQRENILGVIAEARWALEHMIQSEQGASGAVGAEATRLGTLHEAQFDGADFDARVVRLDQALLAANFDQARELLETWVALHERFYGDPQRRALAEDRVKHGWEKLPVQLRIELIEELAESALRHGDGARALSLTQEASALLRSVIWLPEDSIRLQAGLCGLRHRAGDVKGARAEIDSLTESYNEQRERIVDVERAGVLRALAGARCAMGDSVGALEAIRRAAEEGMENPNARPRANDLIATCLLLARTGLEPDPRLSERLRQIRAALAAPW